MPIDYKNMQQTIDYFEKGNITRDRFLSYLKTQMEQVKTENEQLQKQIEAAQQAAKMAQRNIDQNKKQGVGTSQDISSSTSTQ